MKKFVEACLRAGIRVGLIVLAIEVYLFHMERLNDIPVRMYEPIGDERPSGTACTIGDPCSMETAFLGSPCTLVAVIEERISSSAPFVPAAQIVNPTATGEEWMVSSAGEIRVRATNVVSGEIDYAIRIDGGRNQGPAAVQVWCK